MDNLLEYIGYYIIISHFGEIGFGGASIVRRYKTHVRWWPKLLEH